MGSRAPRRAASSRSKRRVWPPDRAAPHATRRSDRIGKGARIRGRVDSFASSGSLRGRGAHETLRGAFSFGHAAQAAPPNSAIGTPVSAPSMGSECPVPPPRSTNAVAPPGRLGKKNILFMDYLSGPLRRPPRPSPAKRERAAGFARGPLDRYRRGDRNRSADRPHRLASRRPAPTERPAVLEEEPPPQIGRAHV